MAIFRWWSTIISYKWSFSWDNCLLLWAIFQQAMFDCQRVITIYTVYIYTHQYIAIRNWISNLNFLAILWYSIISGRGLPISKVIWWKDHRHSKGLCMFSCSIECIFWGHVTAIIYLYGESWRKTEHATVVIHLDTRRIEGDTRRRDTRRHDTREVTRGSDKFYMKFKSDNVLKIHLFHLVSMFFWWTMTCLLTMDLHMSTPLLP